MPRPESKRIQGKIKAYAEGPESQRNNMKALKGSKYIRLRVGDWRVIIDERGDVLDIINIGARGGVSQSRTHNRPSQSMNRRRHERPSNYSNAHRRAVGGTA